MEKIVKEIIFNQDIDEEGEFIHYAQLNFPYFSPADKGGRVYFRTDRELDKKMRNIRELSKKDIRDNGKELVLTYQMNGMTLKDFSSLFDMFEGQKTTVEEK